MPADFVSARLMAVESSPVGEANSRGRYAWWVGDESQKARVMYDSYLGDSLVSSDKIFRSQAPASTGTSTIAGLASLTADQQVKLGSLPSLNTLDVVSVQQVSTAGNVRASQKSFHAVSSASRSVLADVREGGLKRDLNTLL